MKKAFRKALSILLVAVMLVSSAPLAGFLGLELPDWLDFSKLFAVEAEAATYSGTCGSNLTWTFDESAGVLEIIGIGAMKNYSSSTAPWYSYRLYIKTIKIGNGVTSIDDSVFCYCTNLTSITIPDSVTSIGARAFYGCESLTSITIPDSVTSIGAGAFEYCTSLTSVTIGNSVTSIGDYAFEYCDSLTSITIPDSVTSIGNGAFYNCDSLTSITIPDSVTSIGNGAFYYCESLTSIIIPDSVTSIGNSAFDGCSSLTSITIPDSVTSIGNSAFEGCNSLTSITIPDSVTSIGDSAFYSCDSLTSITIGNSVTSIGYEAFFSCTSLTSITIPDSVISIGNYAFYYCTSLTSITIPDSVISIGNYAFYYCTSLTSITIPDSVTSIGKGVFGYCDSLTSITIGNSVTSIGADAFAYCYNLTSITIPDSVTSIGNYAFAYCYSLSDVYYSGTESQWNAISIGDYNNCLTNATIHFNYSSGSVEPDTPESNNTKIEFAQAEYTINRDRTIDIKATIASTDNINDITVDWSCSEPNAVEISNVQKVDSADGKSATLSATVEGLAEGTYDLIITSSDGASAKATLNIEGVLLDDGLNVFVNNTNLSYVVGDMVIFAASQISNNNFTIPKNISVSVSDESALRLSNIFTYEQLSNSSLAFLFDSMPEQFKNSTFVLLKAEKAGIAGVTITNTATNESVNVPVYISVDEYATLRADNIPVVEYASVPTLFGFATKTDYYNYYINGITVADFDYKKTTDGYEFSFNAYNDKQSLGVVEIYQSDGTLIGLEKIDKFEPTGTSIYKTFEAGWNLIADTINNDALSFRGSQVAKHTAVTVTVPKGGFIRITNDSTASTPCFLVNIFDVILTSCDIVSSFGAMPDKQMDFSILGEKFYEKVVEVSKHFATSSYLKGGQIKKHLEKFAFKKFSETATVSTMSNIGTTAKGILLDLDIDFGELCKEAGLGTESVAEEVFNAMSGPAGATLGILFWANKCLNYMTQINDWANTAGKQGFMGIVTPAEDYNTGNLSSFDGVILEGNGNINPESVLQTIKIQETGEDAEALSKIKGYKESVYYDISLLKNGVEVQPNGEVLVHIPVPDGFGTNISVMRYGNGKWEEIDSTIQNGMITIKIDHFCKFAILSLDVDNAALTVDIRTPSTTSISYGDSIVLHADVSEALPAGWSIKWEASNGNFSYSASADGTTCTISPSSNGDTTFTATVYDAEGNEVSSDTQTMTSKAGFFQKLAAFFKKLFGLTKVIPQAFNSIY